MHRWNVVPVGLVLLVAAQNAAAGEHPSLAVLPLRTETLPDVTVRVLDNLLVATVDEQNRFDVISPQEINAILGIEKMKDTLGCDESSCAAELGGALGVQYVLLGNVDVLGDKVVITLSLLDADVGTGARRVSHTVANDENLFADAIITIARELFAERPSKSMSPHIPTVAYRPSTSRATKVADIHFTHAACLARFGESSAGSYAIVNGAVGYRLEHTEMLSTRLRVGFSFYDAYNSESNSDSGGLFLGLGEELTITLIEDTDPWPTLSTKPLQLIFSVDAETHLGRSSSLQLIGMGGFRIWWLYVQGGGGLSTTGGGGGVVALNLGLSFAF